MQKPQPPKPADPTRSKPADPKAPKPQDPPDPQSQDPKRSQPAPEPSKDAEGKEKKSWGLAPRTGQRHANPFNRKR